MLGSGRAQLGSKATVQRGTRQFYEIDFAEFESGLAACGGLLQAVFESADPQTADLGELFAMEGCRSGSVRSYIVHVGGSLQAYLRGPEWQCIGTGVICYG